MEEVQRAVEMVKRAEAAKLGMPEARAVSLAPSLQLDIHPQPAGHQAPHSIINNNINFNNIFKELYTDTAFFDMFTFPESPTSTARHLHLLDNPGPMAHQNGSAPPPSSAVGQVVPILVPTPPRRCRPSAYRLWSSSFAAPLHLLPRRRG